MRKTFLYIHTNIVTKKWGEKRAKQFFQKHTNSANKKCWGKNRRKKVRKTFFYIHTNIVTKKWGGKNSRNNFSRNTRIMRSKIVEKKIVGKKCGKSFLYLHEFRKKKVGEKKRESIFPETHE